MYRVDHILREHIISIQTGKTVFVLLHEGDVHYMTSNHSVDKRSNDFPNYVLNISFCEVLNSSEVFTLDVDNPVL